MKTPLKFASLLIIATSSLFSGSVEVGISEAQLLEQKELAKAGKASVGSKTIYDWPDMEVWVENGKVTKVNKHAVKSQAEIAKADAAAQKLDSEHQEKMKEQSAAMKKRQAELYAAEIEQKKKAEAEQKREDDTIYVYGADRGAYSRVKTRKPNTSLVTGNSESDRVERSKGETHKIETSPAHGIEAKHD